jgi:hypothetical protein
MMVVAELILLLNCTPISTQGEIPRFFLNGIEVHIRISSAVHHTRTKADKRLTFFTWVQVVSGMSNIGIWLLYLNCLPLNDSVPLV